MAAPALSGSPTAPSPPSNIAEWIFSNPFSVGSEVLKQAPVAVQNHSIPTIPADKSLLVDPTTNAVLSWSRACIDTLRIAKAFQSLGLRPSKDESRSSRTSKVTAVVTPVVMFHLSNSLPFAPLLFGVFAAGLTATLANPSLSARELAWLLQNSEPKVIVTTAATVEVVKQAIEEVATDEIKAQLRDAKIYVVDPRAKDYSSQANIRPPPEGTQNWNELLHPCPIQKPMGLSLSEYRSRAAVILWSSGTTGKSKGVVLSHNALISSVAALWHVLPEWGGEERFIGISPFFHVFGLATLLLIAPSCGATIFVMEKFSLPGMLKLVSQQRITYLHMAPPVGVHLSKSPYVEGADMSSVRGALSGGAPLPPAIVDAVYKRVGFVIKMGYGLSEAASVCNQVGQTYANIQTQHGCAGPPLPGVEVKIISLNDKEKILRTEEEGEVLVRSPSVMNYYLNNEAATAESLDSDGWFHTGDIGKLDERGYLWITDRLKEMIKVKGFQVAPAELEALLCSSEQVADAAVTSVYDDTSASEIPRAYIVPQDPHLLSYCTNESTPEQVPALQDLGLHLKALIEAATIHYKWLRGNIVFIQNVPKNPAGKILRRELRNVKGVEVIIYPAKEPVIRAKL